MEPQAVAVKLGFGNRHLAVLVHRQGCRTEEAVQLMVFFGRAAGSVKADFE
jgi:hypothetical protein